MRIVLQRVDQAAVQVEGRTVGAIGRGLLVLAGFETADTAEDLAWISGKIVRTRVFPDEAGVMNRSVMEVGGGILVVSQFTLHASTRKGNRPSYSRAAPPEVALPLYQAFLRQITADLGGQVAAGEFGAAMQVSLVNNGPVTLVIDSRNRE
jgi:D-tyrosyl-tRNA(Tyr) deacylase